MEEVKRIVRSIVGALNKKGGLSSPENREGANLVPVNDLYAALRKVGHSILPIFLLDHRMPGKNYTFVVHRGVIRRGALRQDTHKFKIVTASLACGTRPQSFSRPAGRWRISGDLDQTGEFSGDAIRFDLLRFVPFE